MADRPTITVLAAGAKYSTEVLNTNFQALQTIFDEILGTNGTTGANNTMTGDLDLDGNTLRNATFDGTVAGVEWKGAWVTATAYVVNDLVEESGNTYIAVTAHTGGTFATDLSAAKWELFAQKGSTGAGSGDLLASNDLSDVDSASTSRTNLGAAADADVLKQGKHTVWIPATAMNTRTTLGASFGTGETATNKVMQKSFDFDGSADEFVQYAIGMPTSWDEGTVTFIPYWTGDAGAGTVIWGLQAMSLSNDDAMDTAFGTAQTSTDTFITADDVHIGPESSAITVAGSPAAGDYVVYQVYRDASADSRTIDAKLLGIRLFVTYDAAVDV